MTLVLSGGAASVRQRATDLLGDELAFAPTIVDGDAAAPEAAGTITLDREAAPEVVAGDGMLLANWPLQSRTSAAEGRAFAAILAAALGGVDVTPLVARFAADGADFDALAAEARALRQPAPLTPAEEEPAEEEAAEEEAAEEEAADGAVPGGLLDALDAGASAVVGDRTTLTFDLPYAPARQLQAVSVAAAGAYRVRVIVPAAAGLTIAPLRLLAVLPDGAVKSFAPGGTIRLPAGPLKLGLSAGPARGGSPPYRLAVRLTRVGGTPA